MILLKIVLEVTQYMAEMATILLLMIAIQSQLAVAQVMILLIIVVILLQFPEIRELI